MTKTRRMITRCAVLALAGGFMVATSVYAEDDVKTVWDKQCAKCHGKDGKGQTTMGKKLKCKDYTDPKVQEKFKDEELIKVTNEGKKEGSKTLMKPYKGVLTEKQIKDLVAHVRKFKKS